MSLNAIVGRNVRIARAERGMTQEDLAAAMGWTRDSVSATECGTNNLSLRAVDRLASCLDLSPAALFRDRRHVPHDPDRGGR
ncbi:MAG TPA: helix-turn-helix transcriptional regulator [Acidimicrobiales bacterium]|nr:helix-turn-helix transcriptional regulator [Acidimicrobiales bacterium]